MARFMPASKGKAGLFSIALLIVSVAGAAAIWAGLGSIPGREIKLGEPTVAAIAAASTPAVAELCNCSRADPRPGPQPAVNCSAAAAPAAPAATVPAAPTTLLRDADNSSSADAPSAPDLSIQYSSTAPPTTSCAVTSFRKTDPASCRDEYAHPFSGCLTEEYEVNTFNTLIGQKPVRDLRCGFLDSKSRAWLAKVNADFGHCQHVLFTVAFFYGLLPVTTPVIGDQAGVCLVAFVDQELADRLSQPALAANYSRWNVSVVDPYLVSPTPPRSAHIIKALGPRLFPSSGFSLYLDNRLRLPANPAGIFQHLATAPERVAIGTLKHGDKARDIFIEILQVFAHFEGRRLHLPANKSADSEMERSFRKGIKGRDFLDLYRTFAFYRRIGYPMHGTGMVDSAVVIANHQNSCAVALLCMWVNIMAQFSMRNQLSFNFVVQTLRLSNQTFCIGGHGLYARNFTLEYPSTFVSLGRLKFDDDWR